MTHEKVKPLIDENLAGCITNQDVTVRKFFHQISNISKHEMFVRILPNLKRNAFKLPGPIIPSVLMFLEPFLNDEQFMLISGWMSLVGIEKSRKLPRGIFILIATDVNDNGK